MALIEFSAPAPYGTVFVNADAVFSAKPGADGSGALLILPQRLSVQVTEDLATVEAMLGAAFRRFRAVSPQPFDVLINSAMVSHVIPNPDHAGVVFVRGAGLSQAVEGTLRDVAATLA
jgi:hypothetical protein